MTLPTDAQERKDTPIFSGVLRYFPRAIAYVATVSKAGNDQHHPGTPLHWDKSKSTDEGDALVRHQMEAGTVDSDGILHSGKVAWRALAQLERELEAAELEQSSSVPLRNPRTLSRMELAESFAAAGVPRPIAAADAALEGFRAYPNEDWTFLP